MLWTAGGFVKEGKTNWNEQRKQEKEAFNKFAQWYKSQYGTPQPEPTKAASNGQNGSKPEAEPEVIAWNEADRTVLVNKVSARFPGLHPQHVFRGLGVKSFDELGTLKEAGIKILDWAYDDCKPFVADVVKYAVDGKNKFLVFRADAEPDSRHIAVRAYRRSSTVKNEWLGEYAYNQLGFDTIDQKPNQWIPLRYSVVVHYEAKMKDNGEVYYVATGLGHKIKQQAQASAG
jgi:hypothetical protein